MLRRGLVAADLDAELSAVAEERLELGGDRRVIGASECGRRHPMRRGGGEKLNEKREGKEKSGNRRA